MFSISELWEKEHRRYGWAHDCIQSPKVFSTDDCPSRSDETHAVQLNWGFSPPLSRQCCFGWHCGMESLLVRAIANTQVRFHRLSGINSPGPVQDTRRPFALAPRAVVNSSPASHYRGSKDDDAIRTRSLLRLWRLRYGTRTAPLSTTLQSQRRTGVCRRHLRSSICRRKSSASCTVSELRCAGS
jgi:hypothetical protein